MLELRMSGAILTLPYDFKACIGTTIVLNLVSMKYLSPTYFLLSLSPFSTYKTLNGYFKISDFDDNETFII